MSAGGKTDLVCSDMDGEALVSVSWGPSVRPPVTRSSRVLAFRWGHVQAIVGVVTLF